MAFGIQIPMSVPDECPGCSQTTQKFIPFCSRCGYDLRHVSYVKKKGKCIYCNAAAGVSTGKPALDSLLTKEHVFGNWLANRYPSSSTEPMIQRLRRPDVLEIFSDNRPELHSKFIKRIQGNYQLKVRNVCSECNNGWMSRLHIEARTLVQALADGSWREFTPQELKTLSRWAVMVSVNLECHAHLMETIDEHLVDLMEGRMPTGWRVYIGLFSSNRHANYNQTRVICTSLQIANDAYQKLKNTAFCIEHLLVNTVSTNGHDTLLELAKYSLNVFNHPHPLTCIWSTSAQETPGIIEQIDDSILDYIDSFS